MNILLYISVLLVNGIFMMLTTLLPLIIYNITSSSIYVGQILTTFMVSLLVIRVIFMKRKINKFTLVVACLCFFSGFLIIYLYADVFSVYFIGAILFGFSIAILPPFLLTVLTNTSKNSSKSIGIYNTMIALSSAFSPFIAEMLYKKSLSLISVLWVFGSFILIIISILICKRMSLSAFVTIEDEEKNKSGFSLLKKCKDIFIILFLSSISYGAIISYLPVYYENIGLSIGLYYLFFWGFYVIAQGFGNVILEKIKSSRTILLSLIGLFISQFMIPLFTNLFGELVAASIYGFSYGLLYNVLYKLISKLGNEHDKSNGFAIVGLMSYVGVGVTPLFLFPFLNDLRGLFMYGSVYIVLAIFAYLIINRNLDKNEIFNK